ncbi:winged helix-turn-helix domain-containing protein [Kibdelosporangium lantanae]|uniref:Winged helix-turn-helix domain-containing protein n=1 Tax=Kibdelosporangium lantanae TaxID=1497396 RepID=A0ABW3MGE2_9PSEU
MKNSLTVRILGPTEVVGPTGPAVLTGTRQRALVALLALNAGNVVTASRLVDAMYGENPPRTAIRTVQSHLARVRQAFDQCGLPNAVITKDPGYVLAVPRSQVDAHVFQDLVEKNGHTHNGRHTTDERATNNGTHDNTKAKTKAVERDERTVR